MLPGKATPSRRLKLFTQPWNRAKNAPSEDEHERLGSEAQALRDAYAEGLQLVGRSPKDADRGLIVAR